MSSSEKHLYEFGEFRLDTAERLLLRDGEPVSLPPKVFDTLVVLIRHSGHLLDKEQLMKELWPDAFVEDVNLSVNISALRKALGESENGQRYIETVPKRGYRFVAAVTELGDGEADLIVRKTLRARIVTDEEESDGLAAATSSGDQRALPSVGLSKWHAALRSSLPVLITGTILILCVVVAMFSWRARRPETTSASAPIRSIAVLPFKPLSPASREEYFELGIADALISKLSNLKELTVRPTSSVRKFADTSQDPIAAGRELKVDAVVDGSIQLVGDRIRVSVQLIRVRDGSVLWAYQCEDFCTDVFTVQDSISQHVASALALKLSTIEQELLAKQYTKNAEALEAYLRGRYYYVKRSPDAAVKSVEYFQRAVDLDPNYALAYAGLAYADASLSFLGVRQPQESMPQARLAAERALKLDQSLSEAHGAMALIRESYDWNWPGAEAEFRQALELNPHDADAHQLFANYLFAMGRLDEAITQVNTAHELDPLSLWITRDLGRAYYYNRQYDRAIQIWGETADIDPRFRVVQNWLSWVYEQKGMYSEAVEADLRSKSLSGADVDKVAELRTAFVQSGWNGYWQRALAMTEGPPSKLHPDGYGAFTKARIYARLSKNDQAFEWLNRACTQRSLWVIWLKVDPLFDRLHSDPRWPELMQRVGLA
jgi:DNA-binding winged helix-turn-helix (wHTH) protein/TolB-like protein/tetratricopeptide (TPR) repeat protein